MIQKIRQPVVHYPIHLETEKYVGEVFGYFHVDSNEYNIVSKNNNLNNYSFIGEITNDKPLHLNENKLIGYWENDQIIFKQGNNFCIKRPYDLLMNIFSRNSGILESEIMLNKSVIICGLGSVGSLVALELARSGVGNFLLVDNDTLAYHNICRHQLGIKDIGNFKTVAIKEQILQINPTANIKTEIGILEDVEKCIFDEFITPHTIIVGCTDNREGDLYANRLSILYKIPFVSIGFWERAFAGEIFYTIPTKMPCYECLFGNDNQSISYRPSTNRHFYTNEENLSDARFEPGISTDINFVTTIGIKLIIDLFNLQTPLYIPRLLNHLAQFTLICNTNDVRIGGNNAEIFSYPLQITTSIKIDYNTSCSACGRNDSK